MNWLAENWLWLVLGGGMVAMHLFGHRHGGAGGGGCCGGGHKAENRDGKDVKTPDTSPTTREM